MDLKQELGDRNPKEMEVICLKEVERRDVLN